MPYGWGVVFSNISRSQVHKEGNEAIRAQILPDHLVLYKEDFVENMDAELFQEKLWGMFNYHFGEKLTLPQIDRVRWHLFPEMRIDGDQLDLFSEQEMEQTLPDIIKIMDVQQEQLARSLGEGHRVIHGVAGSGKTLILGYRCAYLADVVNKPILVLCYNISLAAKLRAFICAKGIGSKVQIYHFHDWCNEQLKTYHVNLIQSEAPPYERAVQSVILAVEHQQIPRAQYGALLIDEGHDFEPAWLKLVVQMIDPANNSLLLLYDDAQTIYKKQAGLGFSLSSVGIQAKGRTTILRINYRNTREILNFAYQFAHHYFSPQDADEDHIPLIEPQAAGTQGPAPAVRTLNSQQEEMDYAIRCLHKWHKQGMEWKDMAILYADSSLGAEMSKKLNREPIPHLWMGSKEYKQAYNHTINRVTLLTMHSSKGLEFSAVIMIGVGELATDDDQRENNARLLYVGMTRAQEKLLITTSKSNEFSQMLNNAANSSIQLNAA